MLSSDDVRSARFTATKFREGYEILEVDHVLDTAADTLEHLERGQTVKADGTPLLTPNDLLAARFTSTRLREGYDVVEVDDLLDEIITTLNTYIARAQRGELLTGAPDAGAEAAGAAEAVPAHEPAAHPSHLAAEGGEEPEGAAASGEHETADEAETLVPAEPQPVQAELVTAEPTPDATADDLPSATPVHAAPVTATPQDPASYDEPYAALEATLEAPLPSFGAPATPEPAPDEAEERLPATERQPVAERTIVSPWAPVSSTAPDAPADAEPSPAEDPAADLGSADLGSPDLGSAEPGEPTSAEEGDAAVSGWAPPAPAAQPLPWASALADVAAEHTEAFVPRWAPTGIDAADGDPGADSPAAEETSVLPEPADDVPLEVPAREGSALEDSAVEVSAVEDPALDESAVDGTSWDDAPVDGSAREESVAGEPEPEPEPAPTAPDLLAWPAPTAEPLPWTAPASEPAAWTTPASEPVAWSAPPAEPASWSAPVSDPEPLAPEPVADSAPEPVADTAPEPAPAPAAAAAPATGLDCQAFLRQLTFARATSVGAAKEGLTFVTPDGTVLHSQRIVKTPEGLVVELG